MAFTAADLAIIDRAIASGVLSVRMSDGSQVTYQSTDGMLRARALIAGQVAATDPANQAGGVTYASWDRG